MVPYAYGTVFWNKKTLLYRMGRFLRREKLLLDGIVGTPGSGKFLPGQGAEVSRNEKILLDRKPVLFRRRELPLGHLAGLFGSRTSLLARKSGHPE